MNTPDPTPTPADYALVRTEDGVATVLRVQRLPFQPQPLPPEKGLEWLPWVDTPAPAFDAMTHGLRQLDHAVLDGRARRVWEVYPLPDEVVAENAAASVASQQAQLWAGADAWQTQHISGVAIGILTIGMLQSKPKALAVTAWTQRLWAEYYRRKAAITPGGRVDADFSSIGPMPHSVPELQAELGL